MQHRSHPGPPPDKEQGYVAVPTTSTSYNNNSSSSNRPVGYGKGPQGGGKGFGPKEKHLVKICLYYVVPLLLLALLTGVLYLNLQVSE